MGSDPTGPPDDETPEGCLDLATLDGLAGKDSGDASARDRAHLVQCERCRGLLDEMRTANRFLRRFRSGAEPEAPTVAPDAGTIHVAGYEVGELLAFGGQGAVYRSVQTATGRDVAIKVPIGDTQRRPSTRYRFQREIELTARLDHPGIVRVFGACELSDGRLGCVMEFVEGVPFDRWAAQRRSGRSAATREIVAAAARVADAIAYAHQRAVMHRDIKPSNVVVTADDLPRVLDFGLAKAVGESHTSFATLTGAFVGTLAYAAPEQLSGGTDEVDLRTDVYALGLLLYQALTGRLPHASDASASELIRQIRELPAARPSSFSPGIGSELDAILLKALAKERDRRYATAGELRDDLLAWLNGHAVRARFDSRWYVVRKTVVRHRRAAAVASALTLAVLGAGAISAYNIALASAAQRREEYESQRATGEMTRADAVQQVIDELLPIASAPSAAPSAARQNLDRLDAKLEAGLLRGRPMVESSIRAMLGSIYADRGEIALAEYNTRQALGISLREVGGDHPGSAQLADQLAGLLLERGKLDEALALATESLETRTATLGPGHADVAASLVTIGRVELGLGRPESAASSARRAGEILQHTQTATPQHALALESLRAEIAAGGGRPAEALTHAAAALRLALENHSDENPRVIRALREYARASAAADDPAAADRVVALADDLASTRTADRPSRVWSELLRVKREVLGERAPALAATHTFMGLALEREERAAAAIDAHYAALSILAEADGPDSLAVADCSYYLQYPLGRLGRVREWCDLLERRYRIYRREFLGRQNIGIVVAHREWAATLAAAGDDEAATAEILATLEEIESLCHGDPVETIRANLTLAEILAANGEYERAASLASDAHAGAARRLNTERQRAALVLATSLAGTGRFDGVADHLEDYLPIVRESGTWLIPLSRLSIRMTERLSGSYREAGLPEPEQLVELRTLFRVGIPNP